MGTREKRVSCGGEGRGRLQRADECRDCYGLVAGSAQEEFLQAHPERKEDDPHTLMIARLGDEKEVREDLERQRKELVARKQALIAENKKRKDDLASLDEQLQKFSKLILKNVPREKPKPVLTRCSRELEANPDNIYERILIYVCTGTGESNFATCGTALFAWAHGTWNCSV